MRAPYPFFTLLCGEEAVSLMALPPASRCTNNVKIDKVRSHGRLCNVPISAPAQRFSFQSAAAGNLFLDACPQLSQHWQTGWKYPQTIGETSVTLGLFHGSLNFALYKRSERNAGIPRHLLSPVRASQSQNCNRTLRPCLPRDSLSVSQLFHGPVTVSSCLATLPDLARSPGVVDRSTHYIRAIAQAIRFRARWCPSLVSEREELLGRAANPFPRRSFAGNRLYFWKI